MLSSTLAPIHRRSPSRSRSDSTTAAITPLSQTQIASFRPYTHYASTAFCPPNATQTWTCGRNCEANPALMPIASGGDGSLTQFWYVGFDPILGEIIVGHQGSDASKILPIFEDLDVIRESLDPGLFPGVSSSIGVHSGFAGSQSRSASDVLAAVKTGIAQHGSTTVTVTGHSLGATIALIDAVFLHLNFPARDQAWADYVDALPVQVTHVHIQDSESGAWLACPGQDNADEGCVVGDVPNIFEGDEEDHGGPYDGIMMGFVLRSRLICMVLPP
ncbi:hypothetical protein V8D89_001665 [Ganoderma adspersum]